MKRVIVTAISVILAVVVAAPMAIGQSPTQNSNRTGTLGAEWWKWAASKPLSESPTDGSYEGSYQDEPKCDGQPVSKSAGKTWFLAASVGNAEPGGVILPENGTQRTCTVPANTVLFFPLVNSLCLTPVDLSEGDPPQKLLECVKHFTDDYLVDNETERANPRFAQVDKDGPGPKGFEDIPSSRIVRGSSDLFHINVVEHSPLGDDYTGRQTAASDGLWITLPPMKPGEEQTIRWGGVFDYKGGPAYEGEPDYPEFEFALNTTYHLSVE